MNSFYDVWKDLWKYLKLIFDEILKKINLLNCKVYVMAML